MAEDNVKAQMRKGILEYCILAILSREDSYAPEDHLRAQTGGNDRSRGYALPDPDPAEERRTADLPLGRIPQGPPRKYYTLTDKGREYLATLDEAWDELVGQIQLIRHGKND